MRERNSLPKLQVCQKEKTEREQQWSSWKQWGTERTGVLMVPMVETAEAIVEAEEGGYSVIRVS